MMRTRSKYWLVYFITAALVVLVMVGVIALFWSDLDDEERTHAALLGPKLLIYLITGMVVNMVLFSSMLQHFFRSYISPLVKLSEETQIIEVANAEYRIAPRGASEVVALTEAINGLASRHIALSTEVQQIVQLSKQGLNDEKRRLEVLMGQIGEGVVVCNVDGRILLYNPQAHDILETIPRASADPDDADAPKVVSHATLGLGRSIFGVVDRRPIIHALNYLQSRLLNDEAHPTFTFTTSRRREQFLRIRIAPVAVSDDSKEIEGYVLSLSDITGRLQADSRRDIFLQSLTISLQQELGRIVDASTALLGRPDMPAEGVAQGEIIDGAASRLLEQIDAVALQHATRLQHGGEPEYLLGADLVSVVRSTLVDKFGLKVGVHAEGDLWLSANSYTVVRGVNYLVGQLTKHLDVERVDLRLGKEGPDGMLTVTWSGSAVKVKTIQQWKECPLMLGAAGRGPVSLSNLLAGRGGMEFDPEEETESVRFKLQIEGPDTDPLLEAPKENRPVYYEFDLFDAKHQTLDHESAPLSQLTYVVFDTETTGLDPTGGDEIISIGGIRVVGSKLRREEVYDQLVDPRRSIPLESLKIHEIFPEMLKGMPVIGEVLPTFHEFVEGAVLVAHNAAFDMRFLQLSEERAGVTFDNAVLDTLLLSAVVHPAQEPHTLDAVAERFGIQVVGRHTALGDAIVTAEILLRLIPLLAAKGIHTLGEAIEASQHTRYTGIEF